MNFEQLNTLYRQYRKHPSSPNFTDMYEEAAKLLRKINRSKVRSSGYGDFNDADQIFNDVIQKLASREVDDFGKALVRSLHNGRLNFFRGEQRRLNHYDHYRTPGDTPEDEDAPTSTVIVIAAPDEYEFTRKKKTEDQRQLISRILESAKILFDSTTVTAVVGPNSDPVTVTAVNEIMTGVSVKSIADSLGIHHSTVGRKIKRLAAFKPAADDLRDYFPTDHEVKREFLSA